MCLASRSRIDEQITSPYHTQSHLYYLIHTSSVVFLHNMERVR